MQRISVRACVCVCMLVRVCKGGKNSPQGAVVHQRGLKKDSEQAYTPSHTQKETALTGKGIKRLENLGGKQIKET